MNVQTLVSSLTKGKTNTSKDIVLVVGNKGYEISQIVTTIDSIQIHGNPIIPVEKESWPEGTSTEAPVEEAKKKSSTKKKKDDADA